VSACAFSRPAWPQSRAGNLRRVSQPVGRFDLALEHGLDVRRLLGRELCVQVEHPRHQAHHPVVPRDVGGGGEVDGADGEDSAQELIHR